MKMKVHQTLEWLNLLSFGTKASTTPTIGIQSAANKHYKYTVVVVVSRRLEIDENESTPNFGMVKSFVI